MVSPLPNKYVPMFPEDFPPNGKKEWPLSWWGIVEPSQELVAFHERKAREYGFPIKKVGEITKKREDNSGGGNNDSVNNSKKKE